MQWCIHRMSLLEINSLINVCTGTIIESIRTKCWTNILFEIVWSLTYEVLTLTQTYLLAFIKTNRVFHSFSDNGFTKLSIDISFLDICVLFEALIYSDKLCSGERNVSLFRTFLCLLHFFYSALLEIQNVCGSCFFFKKYFFEKSIKGRKKFSKIM